jgi:hypothetical protein
LTSAPTDSAHRGGDTPADPRRELVRRVSGSAAFHKTWRLRELFLFLCERALRDPANPPREAEIGAAVFGRGEQFDPSADPLVRVQASQLRKRLHLYFTAEGAAEPVVIEIPKGAYTPVFRERSAGIVAEPEPDEAPPPPRRTFPLILALSIATATLAVLSGLLWMQNRALRQAAGVPAVPQPTVERLWRQIFANGRPTNVVLADANLSVFLDLTKRVMSATEYQREQLRGRATPAESPEIAFARELAVRRFASVIDADLAHRIGRIGRAYGGPTELIFARDASAEHFKAHNVVLSGSPQANPWVELFDERVSFDRSYDKRANVTSFVNSAPAAGEPARFEGTPDQVGFCRVAFVPNLDATGSALLLTGTDNVSTAACIELVTDEAALHGLARRLAVGDGPFPYFEAMLRVKLVLGAPLTFETVAHRTMPAR